MKYRCQCVFLCFRCCTNWGRCWTHWRLVVWICTCSRFAAMVGKPCHKPPIYHMHIYIYTYTYISYQVDGWNPTQKDGNIRDVGSYCFTYIAVIWLLLSSVQHACPRSFSCKHLCQCPSTLGEKPHPEEPRMRWGRGRRWGSDSGGPVCDSWVGTKNLVMGDICMGVINQQT